jgi:phytoene dehydrogenase-like protein
MPDRLDVLVVGAGFGGLGAALALAERGAHVALAETLAYPGGCASTFTRRGVRYESGATLFSGFGEGQLFAEWIDRYDLDVPVTPLDPMVELRAPGVTLPVAADRDRWIARLVDASPRHADGLRRFFALQGRCADALWSLFGDPALLPPFGLPALLRHAARVRRYLPILPWIGRPLMAAVERFGLADCAPLRLFLDAVCQITVQTSAAEAEAPFAFATMDYYFRGTGHVDGGIGRLAWALVDALERQGGEVLLANRVKGMTRRDGVWKVQTRRGDLEAPVVVANLLPDDAARLAGLPSPRGGRLGRLSRAVRTGWGAAMLYLVIEPDAVPTAHAHHLELVQDPGAPFLEGNHLFCSVSAADEDRAPDGGRTVTVSTHVPMDRLEEAEDRGAYVAAVQSRMQEGLAALAPALWEGRRSVMTGSPRTFERFTGRRGGFVGGIPRRHGLANYRDMWPGPIADGLYLVGDSVFPGQSTLATALGGVKLADHLAARPLRRRLGAGRPLRALPSPA